MRNVQVEIMGESDAPVFEAQRVEYGPDLLVITEKDVNGVWIRHTFPWCNVRTVREWVGE
jgi:hypothetical protein